MKKLSRLVSNRRIERWRAAGADKNLMTKTGIAGLEVETRPEIAALERGEPARYLVLGDFGARALGVRPVDPETLDGMLDIVGVEVAGLPIHQLEDFHPDRLYQRLDLFRDLREMNPEGPVPIVEPRGNVKETAGPSNPEWVGDGTSSNADPFADFVRRISRASALTGAANNPRRIEELGERMRELLHHPRFQTLESAWRGLDFAVRRAEDESASIYMAQYAREDLAADLAAAADLKTTRLYELFQAHKWGGVFGLYSFSPDAADIEILGRLASIAEQARAPFIAHGTEDMGPYWEELRSIPEAGYLALAVPRFLLRLPYGARTSPIQSFEFEEMPEAPLHDGYLWAHPAWACLCVAARGVAAGPGQDAARLDLRGVPLHTYQQNGESRCTPCTEVAVTEAQARALTASGLVPLIWYHNADRVRVGGLHAINGRALPWA
jgi:EvpB/VC_A0108, tail sheath N-terminal domain